jgi:hypothetical protein
MSDPSILKGHPIAKLIKSRFNYDYYDGILTIHELNRIKEKMDEAKKKVDEYSISVSEKQWECRDKIHEQKKLCRDECVKKLDEHLKICQGLDDNGKYKCTKNYISYDCQFKQNGRCSHYYEIEELENELAYYNENIRDMRIDFYDFEVIYNRALAKKENRLEDYDREMEQEWEDYCFDFAQKITY